MIWGVLLLLVFITAVILLGLLILLTLKIKDKFSLFLFSFPFGSLAISFIIFITNTLLNIRINRTSILLTLLFLIIIFSLPLYKSRKNIFNLFTEIKLKTPLKKGFLTKILVWCILIILFLMFLRITLVPIKEWDAFAFHLPFAKAIYQTGNVLIETSPSSFQLQGAYPPYVFLFYAFSYFMYGSITYIVPKLFPFVFGLLNLMIIYWISRDFLMKNKKIGLMAILLSLSAYTVSFQMLTENTDTIFSFFGLAAIYSLLKFYESKSSSYLYLAGGIIGALYWAKHIIGILFGIFIIVILLLIYLFNKLNINFFKEFLIKLKDIIKISVIALIIMSPVFIRNYLKWGDPLYPFLGRYIGGYLINDWVIEHVIPIYLNVPFYKISLDTLFGVGGLILAFLIPSILLFKKPMKKTLFLFLISIIYFLVWLVKLRTKFTLLSRLLVPSIYLFAIIASPLAIRFLKNKVSKKIKFCIISILILYVIYNINELLIKFDGFSIFSLCRIAENLAYIILIIPLLVLVIISLSKGIYFKKITTLLVVTIAIVPSFVIIVNGFGDSIFIRHDLGKGISPEFIEPAGEWMDKNLPENSIFLSLESRWYIIPRKIFPEDHPFLENIYKNISLEGGLNILKQQNITYVYYNNDKYHPLYDSSVIHTNLNNSNYFKLIYNETHERWDVGVQIYEIIYPNLEK